MKTEGRLTQKRNGSSDAITDWLTTCNAAWPPRVWGGHGAGLLAGGGGGRGPRTSVRGPRLCICDPRNHRVGKRYGADDVRLHAVGEVGGAHLAIAQHRKHGLFEA